MNIPPFLFGNVGVIRSQYGTNFEVTRYSDGDIGLFDVTSCGARVDVILSPKQARQLRKALKKALRP